MISLSASGLWRAEKCAASASLPRVPQLYADAAAGQAEHKELEHQAPKGSHPEAAFALNPETGVARFLGCGMQRDYSSLLPGELPGTADLVAVETDCVRVRDYKTGYGYDLHSPHPEKNLQLAFFAVACASVFARERVILEIERTATGHIETHEMDAFAIAGARERIRAIWRRANEPSPQVVAGDHCWRCECIRNCPAHLTMAVAFSEGLWPGVLPTDGLTIAKVAQGWEFLANAKRLLGLVEKTYRAFASLNPIPLANGKVLGEHEVQREELDGLITYQTIRDLHGEPVARQAVTMEATKSALENALKPLAPNGKRAGMVREALQAIRDANGVVVKRGVRVEEYQPKE